MILTFEDFITEGRLGKIMTASNNGDLRKEDNRIVKLVDGEYFDFSDNDELFFRLKNKRHFRKMSYDAYDVYEFECVESDRGENYVYLTYDGNNETGYSGIFFTEHSIIDNEDYGNAIGALANIDSSKSYVFSLDDKHGFIEIDKSGSHYSIVTEDDDQEWWVFWSKDGANECAYSMFIDSFDELHTDMFVKSKYTKQSQFERYQELIGDSWFDYEKMEQYYLEEYCDDEYGDEGYRGEELLDFLLTSLGSDGFFDLCQNNNIFDVEELARQVVEYDGPANTISSYSNDEFESKFDGNTYYSYRMQ